MFSKSDNKNLQFTDITSKSLPESSSFIEGDLLFSQVSQFSQSTQCSEKVDDSDCSFLCESPQISQTIVNQSLTEEKDFITPPLSRTNNNSIVHRHQQNKNNELIESSHNSPWLFNSRSVSFGSNTSKSPCVDINVNYCFSDLKKKQSDYFIRLDEYQNSLDDSSSIHFVEKPPKASPKSLFLSSWASYILSSHLAISMNKQFECDYLSHSHLSLSKTYITVKSLESLLSSLCFECDGFLKSFSKSSQKFTPSMTLSSLPTNSSSSLQSVNLLDYVEKRLPFALNLFSLMEFGLTDSYNICLLNSLSHSANFSSAYSSFPSTFFSSFSSVIYALDGLNFLYGFVVFLFVYIYFKKN
jgi:hypothetical protein